MSKRDKNQLILIWALAFISAVIAWALYSEWTKPVYKQHNSITCTEFVRGYEDDGTPICGSVSGCAYGDSIPLGPECDKAAAQQIDQQEINFKTMEGK